MTASIELHTVGEFCRKKQQEKKTNASKARGSYARRRREEG